MTNRKSFAIAVFALMILFGAALFGCNPSTPCPSCPTCVPTPTVPVATPTATPIPILWDERLTTINVSVRRTENARYQIIAGWLTINGQWGTPGSGDVPDWAWKYHSDDLGGDHNVFGICLDANGNIVGTKTFVMTDGGLAAATPMPYGWANQVLAGQNWDPAKGPGPYCWQALNGDMGCGFGMPHNWHYSFFFVWQERPGYVPTEWERSGFSKE